MLSALLSPLYGKSTSDWWICCHKGPVIWGFGVFFLVSMNKLWNKQWSFWYFEMAWPSSDVTAMKLEIVAQFWWEAKMSFKLLFKFQCTCVVGFKMMTMNLCKSWLYIWYKEIMWWEVCSEFPGSWKCYISWQLRWRKHTFQIRYLLLKNH